jgi:hypothetical protein
MTVTPVVGVTTTPRMTTYMSTDMFANHARRGVAVDQLVPRGRPADQIGALAQYIDEASAWIDHLCQQILTATSDTVLDRVNVDVRGYCTVHPRYRPVIAVTAFSLGWNGASLQPYTSLANIAVEVNSFTVPSGVGQLPVSSSQGPIQFGNATAPRSRAWTQYTYQNGYPVTTLTAPITAGDTTITVADTTGIVNGNTWLTVYADPAHRWTFLAGQVSTAPSAFSVGTGPGTVTLPAAAPYSVPELVMISALPKDVISACVLATRSLIKDANPGAASGGKNAPGADDDLAEAADLLRDFVAPIA